MTGVKESTLQALRLRYNAALAAHQSCARALTEARMGGASSAAIEAEERARAELDRARAALLAGMTEAITGHPAETPGPDKPRPRPRDPERDAE